MIRPSVALVGLLMLQLLAACNTAERLENVGRAPPLSPIGLPAGQPRSLPVTMPMPAPEPVRSAGANSLWRSGAKGFFRDQRARRVGDVLTVDVTISDRAALSNETNRERRNRDGLGIDSLFGLQTKLHKVLPGNTENPVDPGSLVEASSDMTNRGSGEVARQESIRLNVAAVISQILPNGNLVLEGRQEVRVNFEVRELYVAGIVRPEDITPANTIPHEKIAELRVAYGGRGQITDVQQPRYGAQVLDIILPY
jgi:flagellar L-ring protein precursor FlgH